MKCDVLIIGAGPAGLSAGIFACRAGLKTICVEKLGIGGQAALSYEIANYPGFEKISGFELTEQMSKHAKSLGLEIVYGEVLTLDKQKSNFIAKLKNNEIEANKVIIACGSKARKLGLDNEEKLIGRGISFCASCDGNFYRDKIVAVVGGGNTAIEDVNYLSRLAKKIYLIHRTDRFRANDLDMERVRKLKNVEILTFTQVVGVSGEENLETITIDTRGDKRELKLDGMFEAIGYVPDLDFLKLDIEKDKAGYIIVDNCMRTNIKNCYAAGDITSKNFRQVITACSDGAIAGNSCIGEK